MEARPRPVPSIVIRPAPRRATDALSTGGDPATSIAVWRTVTLGTHRTLDDLRQALAAARCRIGDMAREALDRRAFTVRRARAEVPLAVVTAGELGFEPDRGALVEIHARARGLGLHLCVPEVALQLRLQYPEQPRGELLHVAMAPILTRHGGVAFVVGNGGAGLFLIGRPVRPDLTIPSTVRLLFTRSPTIPDRSVQPET